MISCLPETGVVDRVVAQKPRLLGLRRRFPPYLFRFYQLGAHRPCPREPSPALIPQSILIADDPWRGAACRFLACSPYCSVPLTRSSLRVAPQIPRCHGEYSQQYRLTGNDPSCKVGLGKLNAENARERRRTAETPRRARDAASGFRTFRRSRRSRAFPAFYPAFHHLPAP
jgi:hypothetical protein